MSLKKVKEADRSTFHRVVLEDNTEGMESYIRNLLGKTISICGRSERFYQDFCLSLFYGVPGYEVCSNREEENGRPNIVLYPSNPRDPAILFELKERKKIAEMRDGIEEAFRQIREKGYEEGILNDGYIGCRAYGICFCKKTCIVEKC